jgi:outer membrane murein-binding lipoprotein Lpp
MTDIDLNFIAKRLDQLGADVANIRDDITVLIAMISRLEASVGAQVQESRATHSQMARFNDRLRKVENAQ